MNEIADQILSALRKAGSRGLQTKELAAKLGIDSEKLAKTLQQMISEQMITMEKSDSNDTTYLLQTTMSGEAERGTVGDLNGCPCFHCLKISRCGIRQPVDPTSCTDVNEWIKRGHTT